MDIEFTGLSAEEIAERLDAEIRRELGDGDDGAVFLLKDGRAMKVTHSRVEAALALAVLEGGRGHPGLPDLHGLWWTGGEAVFPRGTRRSYTRYVILRDEVADVFDGLEGDMDPDRVAEWEEAAHYLNEGWASGRWPWIEHAIGSRDGKLLIPVYGALLWARQEFGVEVRDVRPASLGLTGGGKVVIRDFGRGIVPDEMLARIDARNFDPLPEGPAPRPC